MNKDRKSTYYDNASFSLSNQVNLNKIGSDRLSPNTLTPKGQSPFNYVLPDPEAPEATSSEDSGYEKTSFPELLTAAPSRRADPRSILRVCSLIFCCVLWAVIIVEYILAYKFIHETFFLGPDVILGGPISFLVFRWEFADFATGWSRGNGIRPLAHIVMELILGLASMVSLGFTAFFLVYNIHRRDKEWVSDKFVSVAAESFLLVMLLGLMISCFSLFGLAIKDHRRR